MSVVSRLMTLPASMSVTLRFTDGIGLQHFGIDDDRQVRQLGDKVHRFGEFRIDKLRRDLFLQRMPGLLFPTVLSGQDRATRERARRPLKQGVYCAWRDSFTMQTSYTRKVLPKKQTANHESHESHESFTNVFGVVGFAKATNQIPFRGVFVRFREISLFNPLCRGRAKQAPCRVETKPKNIREDSCDS